VSNLILKLCLRARNRCRRAGQAMPLQAWIVGFAGNEADVESPYSSGTMGNAVSWNRRLRREISATATLPSAAVAVAATVAVDTGWCGGGLSRLIYTAWTKHTTAACVAGGCHCRLLIADSPWSTVTLAFYASSHQIVLPQPPSVDLSAVVTGCAASRRQ